MTPFRPHPLARGGHQQTLLGYWHRRKLAWNLATEDVVVAAGDDVRLLLRASWQPGPRESRPALVIVHGLGGWDGASYGIATGLHAWSLGWHVLRMNMRGAGHGVSLCARLYNAGLDDDLLAVLSHVAGVVPRIALVGFSLGANVALLAVGRKPQRVPDALMGVATVSPPLDLAACAAALERPVNRLYQRYFMVNLRESYRIRQRMRPDLYAAGVERGLRTVREFDDAITAPHGGFRDVNDYYATSSSGPYLTSIVLPTLLVAAQDDPMIPAASVAAWPLPASGLVRRELLPTGGHVGFVAPTAVPGRFWAGERVLAFLEELRAHGAAEPGYA